MLGKENRAGRKPRACKENSMDLEDVGYSGANLASHASVFPFAEYSFFEGGARVASFVASPLLPKAVQGTTNHALLHISDWCVVSLVLVHVPVPLFVPVPVPVFVPLFVPLPLFGVGFMLLLLLPLPPSVSAPASTSSASASCPACAQAHRLQCKL